MRKRGKSGLFQEGRLQGGDRNAIGKLNLACHLIATENKKNKKPH
jgi:hypothetical protein